MNTIILCVRFKCSLKQKYLAKGYAKDMLDQPLLNYFTVKPVLPDLQLTLQEGHSLFNGKKKDLEISGHLV